MKKMAQVFLSLIIFVGTFSYVPSSYASDRYFRGLATGFVLTASGGILLSTSLSLRPSSLPSQAPVVQVQETPTAAGPTYDSDMFKLSQNSEVYFR